MTPGSSSGWQTALCDLAIILFMITAAAVSEARDAPPQTASAATDTVPLLGEPVALWRAAPGGPSLREWLAREGADPRLQLTIVAATAEAQAALALAATADRPARLVIEPETDGPPYAALGFDRQVAQPLRSDAIRNDARPSGDEETMR